MAKRMVELFAEHCGMEGWINTPANRYVSANRAHIEWAWNTLDEFGKIQEMLDLVRATSPYLWSLGYGSSLLHIAKRTYDLISTDKTRVEDQARLLINNLAWLHFVQHQYDEALALYVQGRERAISAGNIQLHAMALKGIGQVYKERGQLDDAMVQITAAVELLKPLPHAQEIAVVYGTLSSLERDMGNLDAAIEHLRVARAIAGSLFGADEIKLVFTQKQVQLLIQAKQLDEAEVVNKEAEAENVLLKRRAGIAYTRMFDALILEARGHLVEAWHMIQEASNLFGDLGMKSEVRRHYDRIRNAVDSSL